MGEPLEQHDDATADAVARALENPRVLELVAGKLADRVRDNVIDELADAGVPDAVMLQRVMRMRERIAEVDRDLLQLVRYFTDSDAAGRTR